MQISYSQNLLRWKIIEMYTANKQHLQTVEQTWQYMYFINAIKRIENAKMFPMKAFLTEFEKCFYQYIFILRNFNIKIFVILILKCMGYLYNLKNNFLISWSWKEDRYWNLKRILWANSNSSSPLIIWIILHLHHFRFLITYKPF